MPHPLQGLAIYENEVHPIFSLCGILPEVVVTKQFGEAREYVLKEDMSGINGIAVIGGDGTFGDVAQGLLERLQKDAGIVLQNEGESTDSSKVETGVEDGKSSSDFAVVHASYSASSPAESSGQTQSFLNLPSAKFASNSIPIAHIPSGSGNGFATSVAGVHDPASTAILIALGKVMFTDVLAVASLDSSSVMVKQETASS